MSVSDGLIAIAEAIFTLAWYALILRVFFMACRAAITLAVSLARDPHTGGTDGT